MKKTLILLPLVLLVGIAVLMNRVKPPSGHNPSPAAKVSVSEQSSGTDADFAKAMEDKARDLQLQGEGTVTKVLPDDTQGIRHQKFIVKLKSGQSLLFAHNIDISPRISPLKAGDKISFKGEYEWTPQGGVMHWTHRDPGGRHPAGWIRTGNKTYQ